MRARLPQLVRLVPSTRDLCHNQSGLRDYWALAMLHGSPAEAPFGDAEAARVIDGARTMQFAPGTSYSYSNGNFRILSDVLQERGGRSFAEMLRERVLARAGMTTAFLAADTRAMPDGTEGYEGTPEAGFRPAENRVLWTGDAGLGASLDDMVAWERHIDATRDDPNALYGRLSAPVTFADGAPAGYGFGLGREVELGGTTGHGGALRGWRCHRLHVAAERVSVVVLFNHISDAHEAAVNLLAAVLGAEKESPNADLPPPAWLGSYVDGETGLSARIEMAGPGKVLLRYGYPAERLGLRPDGTAQGAGTRLRFGDGGVWMDRPGENRSVRLQACPGAPAVDGIAGDYRCDELAAGLTLADAGGTYAVHSRVFSVRGAWSGSSRSGLISGSYPAAARWTIRRQASGPSLSNGTERAQYPACEWGAGLRAAYRTSGSDAAGNVGSYSRWRTDHRNVEAQTVWMTSGWQFSCVGCGILLKL